MKKLIGFGIAAMMVMGLAGSAMAAIDADWALSMKAYNQAGSKSQGVANFGTKTGGNDGPNFVSGEDGLLAPQDPALSLVGVYTKFLKQGTVTKSTSTDLRAPITAVGQVKTWQIWMTGGGAFLDNGGTNYVLKLWNDPAYALGEGIELNLYSVSAFGGARTAVWSSKTAALANSEASGATVWTSPELTDNAITYRFELDATGVSSVPEPGSVVAMLSGLVGLAGYGIRRRK